VRRLSLKEHIRRQRLAQQSEQKAERKRLAIEKKQKKQLKEAAARAAVAAAI
jgi:hypothetical protein